MGGKINAYVDCVSPYSYYAFLHLRKHRELLATYEVEVEFHPILLGGVVAGTGNTPPWKVAAKAKYISLDRKRAERYFGAPTCTPPPFFPVLTVLPQRCMLFVKDHFSRAQYEAAFDTLWTYLFIKQRDISQPENTSDALKEHFNDKEVQDIMKGAATVEYKQALIAKTQKCIDLGAFGAPFFWVSNGDGAEEPFFGSDRFHFMWEFLQIPWSDIAIQRRAKL